MSMVGRPISAARLPRQRMLWRPRSHYYPADPLCVCLVVGVDIEPLHQLPEKAEAHHEYGGVIAACIVVNLCTLIGLLTLVPGIKGLMESPDTRASWLAGSSAFATGALLAAAGFLMVPECKFLPTVSATCRRGIAA